MLPSAVVTFVMVWSSCDCVSCWVENSDRIRMETMPSATVVPTMGF